MTHTTKKADLTQPMPKAKVHGDPSSKEIPVKQLGPNNLVVVSKNNTHKWKEVDIYILFLNNYNYFLF